MLYARLLHCTHHAGASVGWFLCEFGWMSAVSGWSLPLQTVAIAIPKSPPLSQAVSPGKTCDNSGVIPVVKGVRHSDIPGALVTSLSNVVHQNVNRKVQLFSGSTTCCVLLFIGYHKMSCCLWAFTLCFHGECGNFNATGLWKPIDANRTFQSKDFGYLSQGNPHPVIHVCTTYEKILGSVFRSVFVKDVLWSR